MAPAAVPSQRFPLWLHRPDWKRVLGPCGLGRVIQSDEKRRQDLILWPAAKESLSHRQDMRLGRAIGRDRQGANRSHDSDPGPIA